MNNGLFLAKGGWWFRQSLFYYSIWSASCIGVWWNKKNPGTSRGSEISI